MNERPITSWMDHPATFLAGEHYFLHTIALPSTSDTSTYEYRCRGCGILIYGKYLYEDVRHTTYSFQITTALDILDVDCIQRVMD